MNLPSGRVAIAVCVLFLTGCGANNLAVPPHDLLQGPARIVSSVVNAGGKSYVVDQLYTPLANNLSGITAGPDRDIWFTGDAPLIGKSSEKSDMSEFLISAFGNATSIAKGPDQNLWVTLYPGAIGRMSPSGHLNTFALSRKLGSTPFSITAGPDSALWFIADASRSAIVRITVNGQMTPYRMKASSSKLQALTYGADGNLWFTDAGTNKIGRMNGNGAVREFTVPTPNAGLSGICQGPDGKLWFLEQNANKVGSVTTSGSFSEYDIPTQGSVPISIVAGPDGALWFTEEPVGKIGRITTSGQITELTLKGAYPRPYGIAVGSDKNIWFTETESYGIIGRVDLRELPDSDPVYSEIALSLGNARPQLGVKKSFPLSFEVRDLKHHTIKGQYPNAIHLSSADPKNAALSQHVVQSSTTKVSVAFSGHYTDAVISASADGGGSVQTATVVPSAPREKKLPDAGYGLTTGADGSLWICLADGDIANYSKTGQVKVYTATTSFTEEGCSILEGPDGNVWFTDYSNYRIGKITPQGQVSFVELGSDASPYSMALGSDGALWFTESWYPNYIGRLTTDGQLTTYKTKSTPYQIVAGPDGNLWFNASDYDIYKITTSGKITEVRNVYRLGATLAAAYDHIWFYDALNRQLDEMTTAGAIVQTYSVPNCLPFALTSGPQHSLWYVDSGNDCVARMTLSGKFTVVPTYSQRSNPGFFTNIVVGPENDLWFTETGINGLGWLDPTTM